MKMDQMTHSRDRPIFIRNFPRWRAAASWIRFNRKLIHTIRQLRIHMSALLLMHLIEH